MYNKALPLDDQVPLVRMIGVEFSKKQVYERNYI